MGSIAMAQATARHILVDNKVLCEELKTKIQGGEDFAKVASEHSSCPSSARGGDLGTFSPGQMVQEFDTVVSSKQIFKLLFMSNSIYQIFWPEEPTFAESFRCSR